MTPDFTTLQTIEEMRKMLGKAHQNIDTSKICKNTTEIIMAIDETHASLARLAGALRSASTTADIPRKEDYNEPIENRSTYLHLRRHQLGHGI